MGCTGAMWAAIASMVAVAGTMLDLKDGGKPESPDSATLKVFQVD